MFGNRNMRGNSGGHLSLRSANPALSSKVFEGIRTDSSSGVMTVDGTVNRVGISLCLLLLTAYFTFTSEITSLIFVGFIGGLIVALITVFKKHLSPITVPVYAALEGLALGGISYVFNELYDGIVLQAIGLTVGILLSLLFAYKSRLIKVTENFKLGIAAATGGIFMVYMLGFIMSLFGSGLSILSVNNTSLLSIGFSLVVVVIASLNLVLDFDFIEEAAEKGAPKYMEWYGAFGLLVTLIWLYIEILHLLAKLQGRR
jgi:uncharacterized YccA/Bax inhibitor family protein